MYSISIPEAGIKRFIPEDLSECNPEQYVEMCGLIFRYQSGDINYDEFRTHAIYKLMKMKPEKSDIHDDLKYSQVYRLSELIDSFMEEENDIKTIKMDYIHNPVPSFAPLYKRYYGPQDNFMDMTFGEYTTALRIFHDFRATGDMELLQVLAAVAYRPKKSFLFLRKRSSSFDGSIRQPLNTNDIDNRAKDFKYAPLGFVYGFYLLFASFQKHLVTTKILWGGKELDFSILFDTKATEPEDEEVEFPGIGMDSIAFSLAESGAFGNITAVENTNFWKIMIRVYDSVIKNNELQKQQENVSNQ